MNGTSLRYVSSYPRSGKCAVVCEGDVAGYENDLLTRWFAQELPNVPIDVWPCGRAQAALGIVDSIGRARPVLVVEDLDYRAVDGAKVACERKKGERMKRDAQVIGWVTWHRHEIENYFLEDQVLVPVMAEAFAVKEDNVRYILEGVLKNSYVEQAVNCALFRWRETVPTMDELMPAVGAILGGPKARWDGALRRWGFPSRDEMKEFLSRKLPEAEKFVRDKGLDIMDAQSCLELFQQFCELWKDQSVRQEAWRTDWGGKEVLRHLRRQLAGESGWIDANGSRRPVDWDKMKRIEQEQTDREIEWALQPKLREMFLRFLQRDDHSTTRREWTALVELVANSPSCR